MNPFLRRAMERAELEREQRIVGTDIQTLFATEPEPDPQCEWPGCDKPPRTRGLCSTHYDQWLRGQK